MEWYKEPKKLMLVAVPAVGIVSGLAFYYMKKNQRIVTVSAEPAEVALCKPSGDLTNWYTVTVTITDGFGNPVEEEFTHIIYLEGIEKGRETHRTGPDGTWKMQYCWQATEAEPMHIDTEFRQTVMHTVECKGAKASTTITLVIPVCLDLPCSCE